MEQRVERHAFLIIAHTQFKLLESLIRQIDHPDNDIYLHIDVKAGAYDSDFFGSILHSSNIRIYNRYNIQWGGFRQIQTELLLFGEALKYGNYSYFHLISGSDLLIRPIHELHEFFKSNPGIQFLECETGKTLVKQGRQDRFTYYHFLDDIGIQKRGIGRLDQLSLRLQKKVGIDRYQYKYVFGFGANWASLTRDAVHYLTDRKAIITKRYRFTHCCDEIYKQTILLEGSFTFCQDREWKHLRYIIWPKTDDARHPKILTADDYKGMKESGCFFARKFSMETDSGIVERLTREITQTRGETDAGTDYYSL